VFGRPPKEADFLWQKRRFTDILTIEMKKLRVSAREFLNSLRVGWFLAVRQIRHSGKGATALIIFIMTLTFLNLVVVSGLLIGLVTSSYQQYKDSYSSDVIVTSAARRTHIENSHNLLSFFENHPDVQLAVPRYVISGQVLGTLDKLPVLEENTNTIGARIAGIDVAKEEQLTGFSRFIKNGKMLEVGSEGQILVGTNLLKSYSSFADANIPGMDLLSNVDVGSKVRVTINNGTSPIVKDFVVRGVVKSKIDEISSKMFIPLDELKRLIPNSSKDYQEIAVHTLSNKATEVVNDAGEFMGESRVRIQTSENAVPSFLRDIETTMSILGNALSSIALVVASITVFIVIYINAVTKRKYIGIMKGIGISPVAIQSAYVFQAFFYGIVGSFFGLAITFGLLKPFFTAYPINFPFSDGILVATPGGAAIRVAILLVVTLIAGYVPAKIIVQRNTLDAILGR
jgi:ABC-type lipoprotein release transport system permease subunit